MVHAQLFARVALGRLLAFCVGSVEASRVFLFHSFLWGRGRCCRCGLWLDELPEFLESGLLAAPWEDQSTCCGRLLDQKRCVHRVLHWFWHSFAYWLMLQRKWMSSGEPHPKHWACYRLFFSYLPPGGVLHLYQSTRRSRHVQGTVLQDRPLSHDTSRWNLTKILCIRTALPLGRVCGQLQRSYEGQTRRKSSWTGRL